MTIIDLKEQPQLIELLADWHHAEWAYLNPGSRVERRAEEMRLYLNDDFIPSTFVYKQHSEVAGSAALVINDMDTHNALSPWLASLYVAPAYRQQGIGSALVRHTMQQAKAHGVKTLYLFTPDQEQFYARLGWSKVEQELYRGHSVVIMRAELTEEPLIYS